MSDELTLKEKRIVRERMKKFIAAGATDVEVADSTGWSQQRITWARRYVIDNEKTRVENLTNLDLYAEFRIQCQDNIHKLDGLIDAAIVKEQITAAVSAVREKQAIAEQLIKKGQELGIIDEPDKVTGALVFAGVDLSALDAAGVKALVQKQSGELTGLMRQLERPIYDVVPTVGKSPPD